ncbi:MAG: Deoxyguanosinetriphosphate triphosphohydrolase-like protein [Phycisphaerae bacterium]|nr:Deoxyguanosinetriphosphate triphosphohydrolase-like protein [Phycisphaerae bacterium]
MSTHDYDREHADPLAAELPPLALDRQRIIHSAAFRRLQYKTQVFVALESDHFRTRLTHTLEVADLARLIAAPLGCNADLAETVALAHDLGHPPFGHAGERALAACMETHGGFEHNVHALRVVEQLEHPYPAFRGLNLTRVVRECLAKHSTQFDKPGRHPLQDGLVPPIEGQIADVADRLAYALHDLQDGLHAGLIERAALDELQLWRDCYDGPPASSSSEWRGSIRPAIDRMQRALLSGVTADAESRIKAAAAQVAEPARRPVARLVQLPASAEPPFQQLEAFLFKSVYRNQRLRRMDSKARRIVTAVFDAYLAEPELMPTRFHARVKEQGVWRVAADYVAGMTDRFCIREHARLFDPGIEG